MSNNTIHLVLYDIGDDNIRESIIQILKDAGLERIQKSVFCGMLNNQKKKDLVEKINAVIDDSSDSVYVISNCSKCFSKLVMLGEKFDVKYISDSKSSVVI